MECNNCWAEYAYESRFSAASSKFSFNSGKERLNFSFLGGFTPGAWVELSSFLLLKIWNGYVYFDLFPSRIQVCHNFQNVVYIFNFLAENAQIQCMLNLIQICSTIEYGVVIRMGVIMIHMFWLSNVCIRDTDQ